MGQELEQTALLSFGFSLSLKRILTLCKEDHNYVPTNLQDVSHAHEEVKPINQPAFLFVDAGMNIWPTPGMYRGFYLIKPSETFQE